MPLFRILFLFCLLALAQGQSFAQSDWLKVKEVEVRGNKVTKSFIILREIDLHVGDSVRHIDLESELEKNRNRIFNTHLFNQVQIIPFIKEDSLTLHIELTEKWYIWPYPVLKFADRNFNIWWETKDISRLNIGLNVFDFNFRGRGEKLKISTLW